MYVVDSTCPELAEQLKTAPLQPIEKKLAGEIIDPEWETTWGHAIAATRYGALTWMQPSHEVNLDPEDPREARMLNLRRHLDVKPDEHIVGDAFAPPLTPF